jgi:hypothetical protein
MLLKWDHEPPIEDGPSDNCNGLEFRHNPFACRQGFFLSGAHQAAQRAPEFVLPE